MKMFNSFGHYCHKKQTDPENSHELLCEVVKLWVTARGYSLTASWLETYKRTVKKTIQKSTGLH